jgi:hypothetical protein
VSEHSDPRSGSCPRIRVILDNGVVRAVEQYSTRPPFGWRQIPAAVLDYTQGDCPEDEADRLEKHPHPMIAGPDIAYVYYP